MHTRTCEPPAGRRERRRAVSEAEAWGGGRVSRKPAGCCKRRKRRRILIKRLREKSYEFAKEGVKNLVPINLVEKLSATPPWRLVVNAR